MVPEGLQQLRQPHGLAADDCWPWWWARPGSHPPGAPGLIRPQSWLHPLALSYRQTALMFPGELERSRYARHSASVPHPVKTQRPSWHTSKVAALHSLSSVQPTKHVPLAHRLRGWPNTKAHSRSVVHRRRRRFPRCMHAWAGSSPRSCTTPCRSPRCSASSRRRSPHVLGTARTGSVRSREPRATGIPYPLCTLGLCLRRSHSRIRGCTDSTCERLRSCLDWTDSPLRRGHSLPQARNRRSTQHRFHTQPGNTLCR
jgi:hypothetical protein